MTDPGVPASGGEPQSNGNQQSKRRQQRSRPGKSLPTDRMKFEAQQRVLATIGTSSGRDKRPVDNQRISQNMSGEISHYTVGLSNGFFVDAGWLEKRGRGEFAASDALLTYVRRMATDSHNVAQAVEPLRASASNAWFWSVLASQLADGAVPETVVVGTLMEEAEAGPDHKPQLKILLSWLEYINLIERSDGKVRALQQPVEGGGSTPEESANLPQDRTPPAPNPRPARLQSDGDGQQDNDADPSAKSNTVLAFDFSCNVTADDLAKLAPEHIKSLFEAVGTIMSLTGSR